MSKVRPYDFGRVFFLDKSNSIPDKIYFQPLGNHVANVRRLVKLWDMADFPGNNIEDKLKSKARVDEAARIHDIGKPYRFKLEVKQTKQGKLKEFIYSFKGHRFLAESSNEWAKLLAIGHHDFSVGDICRDSYKLKKNLPDYQDILTNEPLAYARELYILEMCDQIEAELACRIIGNDEQAESRAFMDFTTTKLNELTYLIDPWLFKEEEEISLPFVYWSMELSQDDKNSLEKLLDSPEKLEIEINKLVEKWWKDNQGKPPREIPKIATIKQNESLDITDKWNCQTFYKKLGGENFNPNPMQQEMWEAIAQTPHPTVLLKSPTGSGKLEAILFPSLAKNYRLILPLPARSLIDDQKERIAKYIQKFSQLPENQNREFSLVIDTGAQMNRQVYQNGKEVNRKINNPRRHLYKGDVILTTIDKFLYRYFAFGDKQKSFIFPLRINQEKTLICFDEAHSYENVAFTNFSSLVKSLYEAGRSLVLMTATLPPEHLKYFDYFNPVIDYIDDSEKTAKLNRFQQETLNHCHPEKNFEWRDEQLDKIPEILLTEWEKSTAQTQIITVVETVKDAVKIYQAVKDELGGNTDKKEQFLFLYHGRLDQYQRPEIYQNLKQRDDNNLPYILITTSAIEVGCDLNSQVLISEICPPENLIQRVGRCNRKGNIPNAKVIVVGKEIQDFAKTLDEDSWKEYKKTLESMKQFNYLKIYECISRSQQVNDYRVIELFSMLHDYVYGADLTCQPLHKKGLIITRSWTPSATLVYDATGGDDIEKMPQITVPVDRLIIKDNQSNKYTNTEVYEHYYNQEKTCWSLRPLSWGCAYQKNIVIKINKSNDEEFAPNGKQEYAYHHELGFVELPGVFIKLKNHNLDEKLLFKQGDSEQKSAIITYTKNWENNN